MYNLKKILFVYYGFKWEECIMFIKFFVDRLKILRGYSFMYCVLIVIMYEILVIFFS